MSWDEAYASRYDEWSAHMTDDVAFYVELAREAGGPVVELAIGTDASRSQSLRPQVSG